MNRLQKLFNIKIFICLVFVIFITVLIAAGILDKINKSAFEKKKQEAKDNPLKIYETGKIGDLSDYFEYCDWEKSDVDKVVLGIDVDGNGLSRYYIDDQEIVKEILEILNKVTFYGQSEAGWDKTGDMVWVLQLLADEKEYSILFQGYNTEYDDSEMCWTDTCYPYYETLSDLSFPRLKYVIGYRQILYNEDIYGKLLNIYNENIEEISEENIEELKKEKSLELTDYFIYTHTKDRTRNFIDDKGEGRITIIYKFPIQDTECYMEVEKYNEGSGQDGAEYCHDIVRVEIFNNVGEYIDLFECSDEELDAFIVKGEYNE